MIRKIMACVVLCAVLALPSACSLTTAAGFADAVKSAPDKAARVVVKRGEAYCKLVPEDMRESFRRRVAAEAMKENGRFVKEEITCRDPAPDPDIDVPDSGPGDDAPGNTPPDSPDTADDDSGSD